MSSIYSSTFIILLCFIGTVNPAPFSLSSSAGNDLSSDSTSQRAIQSGNDVTLISHGAVELILTERTLIVDVDIKSCIGKATKPCVSFDGFCGFQLIGTKDEIQFIQDEFPKKNLRDCGAIQMHYDYTEYCLNLVPSCNPEIDEDGKIKIEIINTECSVSIKNAIIYVPLTSTSSTSSSPTSDSASHAGLQWYHWVAIVLGILLIVFCCIGIWSFVWKKNILSLCKKKPAKPAPVESFVSTTVTKENKTITKDEGQTKEVPKPKEQQPKAKTPKPSIEPTLKPKLSKPAPKTKNAPKASENPPKKEVEKEKKKSKSKTKTPSTESYSAPFCLLPFPAQSFDPEPEPEPETPAQKRRRNAEFPRRRFADSLEMEAEKREEADKKMMAEFNERRRREKY